MKRLRGIAASRGIASGPAFRFQRITFDIDQATIDDPVAELGRADEPAGLGQRRTSLDDQARGHGLVVGDGRADMDPALVVKMDFVQSRNACDVDQRAHLPGATLQLDQQISPTGNDPRLCAMLGQQAEGVVKGG